MSYKQLNEVERDKIAVWINRGWKIRQIAKKLNRDHSSISREIKRNNGKKQYRPHLAQKRAEVKRHNAHKKVRLKSHALRIEVERLLRLYWSPELISGRLKQRNDLPNISYEAIYQWVYNEAPDLIYYLPRKHKQRKKKGKNRKSRKTLIPNRVPIEQRPKEANNRSQYGHWETDLLIGRGRNAIQVLVERKSRYVKIEKIITKTSHYSSSALMNMFVAISDIAKRSITYDNGTENVLHGLVNKKLAMKSYFCNPYHSWEKGTVENTNELIRRFFPKKTNFDNITQEEIKQVEDWLNNRPRKCLDYYSPKEVLSLIGAVNP